MKELKLSLLETSFDFCPPSLDLCTSPPRPAHLLLPGVLGDDEAGLLQPLSAHAVHLQLVLLLAELDENWRHRVVLRAAGPPEEVLDRHRLRSRAVVFDLIFMMLFFLDTTLMTPTRESCNYQII